MLVADEDDRPVGRVAVYEQIARNRRASLLLLGDVVAVWLILGYVIGFASAGTDAGGVGFLAIFGGIAVVFGLLAYYRGPRVVLSLSGAREIGHDEEPQLWNVIDELRIGAGLPMPRLYVIQDLSPNAFATGRDPRHASIAVTTGLLHRMNRAELQGVLAHELAHVRNYDVRYATLVAVLVGLVALTSDYFLRTMVFRGGRAARGAAAAIMLAVALILAVVAPISARLVQLAISRRREFLADASAVEVTRDPLALVSALEKMDGDPRPTATANRATAHLYIMSPIKSYTGNGLFDTHPPTEQRIAALLAMAHGAPDAGVSAPATV